MMRQMAAPLRRCRHQVGLRAARSADAGMACVAPRRFTSSVLGAHPMIGSSSQFSTSPGAGTLGEPYRAFLLDMDGVLHQFGKPIDGASEFLKTLVDEHIPFMVITNECRYTNAELAAKLKNILDVDIPPEQIYTCANSMRDFFIHTMETGWRGNVYCMGEQSLIDNVTEALSSNDECTVYSGADGLQEDVPYCDFVGVGTIRTGGPNDNWLGAERACAHLRAGAKLLYSNPDWFEITAEGGYKFGCPMPLINLLTQVASCSAYNLGKPNPFMLRRAHQKLIESLLLGVPISQRPFINGNILYKDILFVGDSLNTDIRVAVENGIDAALVMSGTTTEDMLPGSALRPNFKFEDIKQLHSAFENGSLVKRMY